MIDEERESDEMASIESENAKEEDDGADEETDFHVDVVDRIDACVNRTWLASLDLKEKFSNAEAREDGDVKATISEIDTLLIKEKDSILHPKDPHKKTPYETNDKIDLASRRGGSKRRNVEHFVRRPTENRNGYEFFECFSAYLGIECDPETAAFKICDYASRLCFGEDLSTSSNMSKERLATAFSLKIVKLYDSDPIYDGGELEAVLEFVFKLVLLAKEFSFKLSAAGKDLFNDDRHLGDIKRLQMKDESPRRPYTLERLSDQNAAHLIVRFLACVSRSTISEGNRENEPTASSSDQTTMTTRARDFDGYGRTLAFVFESVACCLHRTGIVYCRYVDGEEPTLVRVRSCINSVISNETMRFCYVVLRTDASGRKCMDSMLWCKRNRSKADVAVFDVAKRENETHPAPSREIVVSTTTITTTPRRFRTEAKINAKFEKVRDEDLALSKGRWNSYRFPHPSRVAACYNDASKSCRTISALLTDWGTGNKCSLESELVEDVEFAPIFELADATANGPRAASPIRVLEDIAEKAALSSPRFRTCVLPLKSYAFSGCDGEDDASSPVLSFDPAFSDREFSYLMVFEMELGRGIAELVYEENLRERVANADLVNAGRSSFVVSKKGDWREAVLYFAWCKCASNIEINNVAALVDRYEPVTVDAYRV
jgi:hypothetical protein